MEHEFGHIFPPVSDYKHHDTEHTDWAITHQPPPDAVLVVADGEPMHQFTIDAIVDASFDDRLIRARVIGVDGRAVTLRILDDD